MNSGHILRVLFSILVFFATYPTQGGLISNSINQTVKAVKVPTEEVKQSIEECVAQKFDSESGCQERGKQMLSCSFDKELERKGSLQEQLLDCKKKYFSGLRGRDIQHESVPKTSISR